MRSWILLVVALPLPACTAGLFSGVQYPEVDRPVVRIETRGGVEYGASTTEGILFLGRTAQTGPCRVHYFLGPTPVIEDGTIEHAGGVYYRADIDLKHQKAMVLERDPNEQDHLVALAFRGMQVESVPVHLAREDGVSGSLLEVPPAPLAAGTGIFALQDDVYRFVGLVAGKATLQRGGQEQDFVVFTGTQRLRELLATPRVHPALKEVIFRPDDIAVIKEKPTSRQ